MTNKNNNDDILVRYAINLANAISDQNPDKVEISAMEVAQVEQQIEADPELGDYISFLVSSYLNIDDKLEESGLGETVFIPAKKAAPIQVFSEKVGDFLNIRWVRYPAIAIASVAILLLLAELWIGIRQPAYLRLVQKNLQVDLEISRSTNINSPEEGKVLLNQNQSKAALVFFKEKYKNIIMQDDYEKIQNAYYLGLAYLKSAEIKKWHLLTKLDEAALDSAIKYFEIARSQSKPYPELNEDVHWFPGLAHVLKYSGNHNASDLEQAQYFLNWTLKNKNRYSTTAQKILLEIE